MNKKENTPLVVLKSIEPYLNKTGAYFLNDIPKEDLIRFKGINVNSAFFFHIKSNRVSSNGRNQIKIAYYPHSDQSSTLTETWIDCTSIEPHFKKWVNLLEQYSNTKTPFDDPIIDSFFNDYYSDFEIIDEEKDKPLESKWIIPLHEHFEEIKHRLEEHKNDANASEIEDIQEEISDLNSQLTRKGRQWVATKISTIWAKMTKMGVKYIKEFVETSRKQLFKDGASKMFELAQKGIEYFQEIEKLG